MNIWREPPGGFTRQQRRQRRRRRIQAEVALVAVVVMSMVALSTYRWATSMHPVERSDAIDLFRAEQPSAAQGDAGAGQGPRKLQRRQPRDEEADLSRPRSPERQRSEPAPVAAAGAEQPSRKAQSEPQPAPERERRDLRPPEEGVYTWATDGHEQVGGARREFPDETQRIITANGDATWKQHHYFSEERQIWSAFQARRAGAEITEQRNKVSFGPVTRETKISFRPPMLAAPSSLRVGLEWDGEWTGDTYGTYSGRVFERTTMMIGGERVEVWGMTYVIDLRGEQDGRVNAQVWFAPSPNLTVKEHYVQDVRSGGAQYHAEWVQTLKSLHPRH